MFFENVFNFGPPEQFRANHLTVFIDFKSTKIPHWEKNQFQKQGLHFEKKKAEVHKITYFFTSSLIRGWYLIFSDASYKWACLLK